MARTRATIKKIIVNEANDIKACGMDFFYDEKKERNFSRKVN